MRLAIFGGTGFLGYNFVTRINKDPELEFTVYSSSPKSLVNIARHDIDVRLYSPAEINNEDVDPGTDYLINFSYPAEIRSGLTARQQANRFIEFVRRQKLEKPELRLIHISTMSVYEPFTVTEDYTEDRKIKPPATDVYATEKAYMESALLGLPGAENWQLHLRPTIIYGPFCHYWTDRIMDAFADGDVPYVDLSGRIQPVFGGDVTRFIHESVRQFIPGIFNFSGTEVSTWEDFLSPFAKMVNRGKLVHDPLAVSPDMARAGGMFEYYKKNTQELLRAMFREPAFDRLIMPVAKLLPRKPSLWLRDKLSGGDIHAQRVSRPVSFFAAPFFSQTRLVSMKKFRTSFPDFRFTQQSDVYGELSSYYRFRFTDEWPDSYLDRSG